MDYTIIIISITVAIRLIVRAIKSNSNHNNENGNNLNNLFSYDRHTIVRIAAEISQVLMTRARPLN